MEGRRTDGEQGVRQSQSARTTAISGKRVDVIYVGVDVDLNINLHAAPRCSDPTNLNMKIAMNIKLSRIGGAFVAATMCLCGASLPAQVSVTETEVTTPVPPAVVEERSTTTTTTETPLLTDDEKDRIEESIENQKELNEEAAEAQEEMADELEDELD